MLIFTQHNGKIKEWAMSKIIKHVRIRKSVCTSGKRINSNSHWGRESDSI